MATPLVNSENVVTIANNFCAWIILNDNFKFKDDIGLPVLRMKVRINLSEPLPCGFSLGEDGDWVEKDWVSFQYERIPSICLNTK